MQTRLCQGKSHTLDPPARDQLWCKSLTLVCHYKSFRRFLNLDYVTVLVVSAFAMLSFAKLLVRVPLRVCAVLSHCPQSLRFNGSVYCMHTFRSKAWKH